MTHETPPARTDAAPSSPATGDAVAHTPRLGGCPCLHTTPCHRRCSCVTPTSSRGCSRCASYGSPAQQRAVAVRLARLIDLGPAWLEACRRMLVAVDGSPGANETADAVNSARAALAAKASPLAAADPAAQAPVEGGEGVRYFTDYGKLNDLVCVWRIPPVGESQIKSVTPGDEWEPSDVTLEDTLSTDYVLSEITPAQAAALLAPETATAGDAKPEPAPCRICRGGPNDPMHGSKYHGSEVNFQHEYEPDESGREADPPLPEGEWYGLASHYGETGMWHIAPDETVAYLDITGTFGPSGAYGVNGLRQGFRRLTPVEAQSRWAALTGAKP